MIELVWLLLPVAAASGWWLARRSASEAEPAANQGAEYFKGLNYLLDDKPDQAIEVFTRMAEIDRDTLETHLTLGNLFRRRGEVDRAIHIHYSLTIRNDISETLRHRAKLELAEDYMRAGLFDRAENLYRSLIEAPEYTAIALHRLLEIYEQEKDWQQAIGYCDQLERMTGQVRKIQAAHYCCELAEEALARNDRHAAREHLRQALARDGGCARAAMLRGHMALADGELETAIADFKAVERQNPDYFIEVIGPLGQCYNALNRQGELLDYLMGVQNHSGRFSAALAELIAEQQGATQALAFLENELKRYPSFMGLRCFVELKMSQNDSDDLNTLYRASRYMLNDAARYRCDHCGYVTKTLNWRCPGCRCWNSAKPLPDMLCQNTP